MFRERLQGISYVSLNVLAVTMRYWNSPIVSPLRLFGLAVTFCMLQGVGGLPAVSDISQGSADTCLILVSPTGGNTGPQKPLPATLMMRKGEIMSLNHN